MLTKEKVDISIQDLPETFTIDELLEKLIFIEKVEEGIRQSETGQVVSNEEVKKIIESWSK